MRLLLPALVLLAAGAARASDYHHLGKIGKPFGGYKGDKHSKPDYSYAYGIKDKYSGVKLDVRENRKGDKTEGQYVSKLADGREQKVSYYVDGKSGFVADVQYDGVAKHPIPIKKVIKPLKHKLLKPFKPTGVPFKPVVVAHKPIIVHHKPSVFPKKQLSSGPSPLGVGDYRDDSYDDDFYKYNNGYQKNDAPFQGHVQQDIYPGQTYAHNGKEFDPYTHSSKLFQQQLFQ